MPRTIQREPVRKAPRRQLATKAARKSAPSTGGPTSCFHPPRAARKSAPSTGPTFSIGRAERDSPSSPGSIIDLTESLSTTNTPPSHAITEDDLALVSEELKRAIASVSEQHLRSAILKVCTESAWTARLLGPLLTPSALGISERKRKRSPQICESCCGEIDDDGDGCCKFRRMEVARREADAEEQKELEEYLNFEGTCENCGGEIDDDDDGCCKFRMMQVARMEGLRDRMG